MCATKMECPRCGGTGSISIPCPACHGNGWSSNTGYNNNTVPSGDCQECGGTGSAGSETCPKCNGIGCIENI